MTSTQRHHVVLVSPSGEPQGIAEKLEAHQQGWLHLAFSVMFFRCNEQGEREYLLQRRALDKYHSGGLWTNTCCSHPKQDEPVAAAAKRRLYEELGIARPLDFTLGPCFEYRAELDNGLIEHEWDQVIACEVSHVDMIPNPDEVADCRWWSEGEVKQAMVDAPERFTAWFADVLSRIDVMARC
ncbi:isopentenyl-diphosphate Delta-isomerase [Salinivibrio kushneri]|uniref:isopentenyl-diphosphate Delta-isomerase n=1 Tax=Salinivibrio kushneri TaxID=1908198 RepID=UPI0009893CBC|nr:isopentenyl-diphosphate Delta-isomerase [Salinivibrio kushneri]OOE53100.1 isopentenyl-diphosphate delta-isomerase [Salinivibrio kushneri]OOE55829.1 isopentenyl-diphosphate delta-isomerase [Salinivibrio kushneri]